MFRIYEIETIGRRSSMHNQNAAPPVAIPLSKGKQTAVMIGCFLLMFAITMFGFVLATLQPQTLKEMNAIEYAGLLNLSASIGVSIMTPIGGKFGDMIGKRNIVIIGGIISVIGNILYAFASLGTSIVPLLILRIVIGLAQGTFTASPFIITALIYERKDIPKALGYIAMAIALGGSLGAMAGGALNDMGYFLLAIASPAIPLIVGIVLIAACMPNHKRSDIGTFDIKGTLLLTVALTGILTALTQGASMGWTHPVILAGLIIGTLAAVALVKVELASPEPMLPLHLLKNKRFAVLVLVGAINFFYRAAMTSYAPQAAVYVMGITNTTVLGALTTPRTIVTVLLPAFVGVWVTKKASRKWQAIAIATLLAAIPMAAMGFTTPSTSIMLYFVMITITGIAESFRSVTCTAVAQEELSPEDMSTGTALTNFFNSLSGTIAAAVLAVGYNTCIKTTPGISGYQKGANVVYWISAIITFIGFLLTVFVIRPMLNKKEAENTAA